jgi:hypothetical protein
MNTNVQPHVTQSALTLEILVEELRAELSNCLDRRERRQIEQELKAAQAALAALPAA